MNLARTLVIGILNIQADSEKDEERAADRFNFDTIQFWLCPDHAWRIRTFAINNDIQIYQLYATLNSDFAIDNIMKFYADVLKEIHVLEFDNFEDHEKCNSELQSGGLQGKLEFLFDDSMAFWNYDGRTYITKYIPE